MTEFYVRACARFGEAGLAQYEISNFATEGHASRHNLKYWQRAPYLGFGVDAHSMLLRDAGAVRLANADSLEAYAAGAGREVTEVDTDGAFEEALFLGLRMNVGVSLEDLQLLFGRSRVEAFAPTAEELVKDGLLRRDGRRVMLSQRGRMISNEVFGELLRGGGLNDLDLVQAMPEDHAILANLLELYIYDFSELLNLDVGESGRFGYSALSSYWSEPGRYAFLMRKGGKLAGFALVQRVTSTWDMAEFFVLRGYRRRGIAKQAAKEVWARFPGQWKVRVRERNAPALRSWRAAVEDFAGRENYR